MSFLSPFEPYQVAAAGLLAGGWGLACGVFERMALAPNRRFSRAGAAYVPAMSSALLAGAVVATTEGRSLGSAVLVAALSFAVGSVPALAVFYLTRRVLRTRLGDD